MQNLFDVLVHNDGWTAVIGNFKAAKNLPLEAARLNTLNSNFLLEEVPLPSSPLWKY